MVVVKSTPFADSVALGRLPHLYLLAWWIVANKPTEENISLSRVVVFLWYVYDDWILVSF